MSSSFRQLLASISSEENKEVEAGDVLLIVFCVITCGIFIGYAYHEYPLLRKIERFFPVSSANMIFGFLFGFILSAANHLNNIFSFDSEFFFIYLLPPIIFCAGYNVPKDFFFHNFGSIMTFAFVGTTISAIFIGSLLFAFGQAKLVEDLSFVENMLLGSLISAVDPVAVILVLKSLNVDEQLKVLLFGESVLNDAAAVVINRVFVSIDDKEKTALEALAPALPLILGVALASILIGTIIGLIIAFMFKHLNMHRVPEVELAAFLLGAFVPYGVAEALDMSGITAVLFAGVMTDYYTYHHLSDESKVSTRQTVQTLSFLSETFVFIYLGMSFFLKEGHYFSGGYVLLTVILCLIARALSVFPLAFILNLGRKHKLPIKHQVILWYSGLRGPVAYALALATPKDEANPTHDNIIITTTIFIVALTTFILGGFSYPFINWLKPTIMRSTLQTKTKTYDISNHWFARLDRQLLRPYFGPLRRVGGSVSPRGGLGPNLSDAEQIELQIEQDKKQQDEQEVKRQIQSTSNSEENRDQKLQLISHDEMAQQEVQPEAVSAPISNSGSTSVSTQEEKDAQKRTVRLKTSNAADHENTITGTGSGHLNVSTKPVDYSQPRVRFPSFIENPTEMSQSQTWSTNQPVVSHTKSLTPPPLTQVSTDGKNKGKPDANNNSLDLISDLQVDNTANDLTNSNIDLPTPI